MHTLNCPDWGITGVDEPLVFCPVSCSTLGQMGTGLNAQSLAQL